ncbi:MAG: hypothetical protein H7333_10570, partial [Bdellovibrionales bacterium]|nr:hypothetical protein [Oligoflexia bacterium]
MKWTAKLSIGILAHGAVSIASPLPSRPAIQAQAFLKNASAQFHLKEDLANLALESISESPVGYHVRFVQTQGGIPVDQASVVVTVDRSGAVLSYVNDYAVSTLEESSSPRFDLPAEQALKLAYESLELTASPTRQKIQNKVLIIDGNPHAVYQINLSSPVDRLWSWEIVVDASSGFVHRSVSRA